MKKWTDKQLQDLVSLQTHPGWSTFVEHLENQIEDANKLTTIPQGGNDETIIVAVKIAQARMSIYNGLLGFMKEAKAKIKLRKQGGKNG